MPLHSNCTVKLYLFSLPEKSQKVLHLLRSFPAISLLSSLKLEFLFDERCTKIHFPLSHSSHFWWPLLHQNTFLPCHLCWGPRMHLELSRHVLGKKITSLHSSDLKEKRWRKYSAKRKKKKRNTQPVGKERNEDESFPERKQFLSWVLKRNSTLHWAAKPNQQGHPGKKHG